MSSTPPPTGSMPVLRLLDDEIRLKELLTHLSESAGVYRMLDAQQNTLYVGKAKNLKKRVSSYFRKEHDSPKTGALVALVYDVAITVTRSESEALVLEYNLIQEYLPKFNILLRDDKSYPYVLLSADQYPRLTIHRGPRKEKGQYFGPFPSAGAVRQSLLLLQKLFRVRQCENTFFSNRSRPCLQYQIERCKAPCVGYVSETEYKQDVQRTAMFYQGKNQQVIADLATQMEQNAQDLAFERAGQLRDQISLLRRVLDKQIVSVDSGDVDAIAAVTEKGLSCVYVLHVREGRVSGSHCEMPKSPTGTSIEELIEAFLSQYYLSGKNIPREIIHNAGSLDCNSIQELLSERSERKIRIASNVRTERASWLEMSKRNAENQIASQFLAQSEALKRGARFQELFALDTMPQRFECFDVSHTMGEATVASCVIFDLSGPRKSDYRRFNIEGITPGDDYAAMYQAVSRRYTRLQKGEGLLPDVLFIDGGPGQLKQAQAILDEMGLESVLAVGISKGPDRRVGQEELYISGQPEPVQLPSDSGVLHFILSIRDEAHRFAITGHRQRRAKVRTRSPLESVEGIGPARRKALLRHFGGLQEMSRAGIDDIATVPGISRALAERIYRALNG